MRRALSALFLAVILATLLVASTNAGEVPVTDPSRLAKALASARTGDVLRLADGTYGPLKVSNRRYAGVGVRIVGSPGVRLQGLTIAGSTGLSFENFTITPTDNSTARVSVDGSSSIAFDHIQFVGTTAAGVQLDVGKDSDHIRVTKSDFTMCLATASCLQPGGRVITVSDSRFHDCFECDMVRGGGSDVTLDGNTFQRALPSAAGKHHNDLVQIMGGGPWTVTHNRFGDHKHGAAQLFASASTQNSTNPIHDLTVTSNLFMGESGYAISISNGAKSAAGPPRRVRIVNNTILSGRVRSLRFGERLGSLGADARPLVANNILARASSNVCGDIRATHNLVLSGRGCPADLVGGAHLNASGAPTAASAMVINRADASVAPPTDFFGHARKGAPDIGAIEFGATGRSALTLAAPARVSLRLGTLRVRHWLLTVRATVTGANRLQARLLKGSRQVATLTQDLAGKSRVAVSLRLPTSVRHAGTLKLALRATTSDGRAVTKTVSVKLLR
jgi:hypothetical protein